MVLDVVVGPAREQLCDFGPLVAHVLVELDDLLVFLLGPLVLFNVRVQVVVPPNNNQVAYRSRHCLPILPGRA